MEDKFPRKLKKVLLSILECPVCLDTMVPPILQCNSGHSLCSPCLSQVTECPVCRMSVCNPVRNFNLEKLSEQFTVPCSNCQKRLRRDDVTLHEKHCPFRIYVCPISLDPNVDCAWSGRRKDILEHVQEAHPKAALDVNDRYRTFSYNFDKQFVHDVELCYREDEIFVSFDHYDKRDEKCSKVIQYLGPAENASKFQYVIELYTDDDTRSQIFTRRVHSEAEEVEDLINNDDCFTMSKKQIMLFSDPYSKISFSNRWTISPVEPTDI